jgi:hypothetical protein
MVVDLMESSLVGHPIENLLFGGSPAPDALIARAQNAFPTASMSVVTYSSILPLCLMRGLAGVKLTG